MSELKMLTVAKNATNDFAKYKYRTIDDILQAVKESEQTVKLSDEVVEVGGRLFVKSTAKSGDEIATAFAELSEHKGMSADQATGAASTYARKYALAGLFGIATGDDPDGLDKRKGAPKNDPPRETGELATAAQRAALHAILGDKHDEFLQRFGGSDKITKAKASEIISEAKKRREG